MKKYIARQTIQPLLLITPFLYRLLAPNKGQLLTAETVLLAADRLDVRRAYSRPQTLQRVAGPLGPRRH